MLPTALLLRPLLARRSAPQIRWLAARRRSNSRTSGGGATFVSNRKPAVEPESVDPDEPVALTFNPYDKEPRQCILCKHKVELDYKNTRLLQQFISAFSGRIYDRHITGLCNKQHDILVKTVAMSRKAGYMPIFTKDPKYLRDPKLFDPMRPIRPHSYD